MGKNRNKNKNKNSAKKNANKQQLIQKQKEEAPHQHQHQNQQYGQSQVKIQQVYRKQVKKEQIKQGQSKKQYNQNQSNQLQVDDNKQQKKVQNTQNKSNKQKQQTQQTQNQDQLKIDLHQNSSLQKEKQQQELVKSDVQMQIIQSEQQKKSVQIKKKQENQQQQQLIKEIKNNQNVNKNSLSNTNKDNHKNQDKDKDIYKEEGKIQIQLNFQQVQNRNIFQMQKQKQKQQQNKKQNQQSQLSQAQVIKQPDDKSQKLSKDYGNHNQKIQPQSQQIVQSKQQDLQKLNGLQLQKQKGKNAQENRSQNMNNINIKQFQSNEFVGQKQQKQQKLQSVSKLQPKYKQQQVSRQDIKISQQSKVEINCQNLYDSLQQLQVQSQKSLSNQKSQNLHLININKTKEEIVQVQQKQQLMPKQQEPIETTNQIIFENKRQQVQIQKTIIQNKVQNINSQQEIQYPSNQQKQKQENQLNQQFSQNKTANQVNEVFQRQPQKLNQIQKKEQKNQPQLQSISHKQQSTIKQIKLQTQQLKIQTNQQQQNEVNNSNPFSKVNNIQIQIQVQVQKEKQKQVQKEKQKQVQDYMTDSLAACKQIKKTSYKYNDDQQQQNLNQLIFQSQQKLTEQYLQLPEKQKQSISNQGLSSLNHQHQNQIQPRIQPIQKKKKSPLQNLKQSNQCEQSFNSSQKQQSQHVKIQQATPYGQQQNQPQIKNQTPQGKSQIVIPDEPVGHDEFNENNNSDQINIPEKNYQIQVQEQITIGNDQKINSEQRDSKGWSDMVTSKAMYYQQSQIKQQETQEKELSQQQKPKKWQQQIVQKQYNKKINEIQNLEKNAIINKQKSNEGSGDIKQQANQNQDLIAKKDNQQKLIVQQKQNQLPEIEVEVAIQEQTQNFNQLPQPIQPDDSGQHHDHVHYFQPQNTNQKQANPIQQQKKLSINQNQQFEKLTSFLPQQANQQQQQSTTYLKSPLFLSPNSKSVKTKQINEQATFNLLNQKVQFNKTNADFTRKNIISTPIVNDFLQIEQQKLQIQKLSHQQQEEINVIQSAQIVHNVNESIANSYQNVTYNRSNQYEYNNHQNQISQNSNPVSLQDIHKVNEQLISRPDIQLSQQAIRPISAPSKQKNTNQQTIPQQQNNFLIEQNNNNEALSFHQGQLQNQKKQEITLRVQKPDLQSQEYVSLLTNSNHRIVLSASPIQPMFIPRRIVSIQVNQPTQTHLYSKVSQKSIDSPINKVYSSKHISQNLRQSMQIPSYKEREVIRSSLPLSHQDKSQLKQQQKGDIYSQKISPNDDFKHQERKNFFQKYSKTVEEVDENQKDLEDSQHQKSQSNSNSENFVMKTHMHAVDNNYDIVPQNTPIQSVSPTFGPKHIIKNYQNDQKIQRQMQNQSKDSRTSNNISHNISAEQISNQLNKIVAHPIHHLHPKPVETIYENEWNTRNVSLNYQENSYNYPIDNSKSISNNSQAEVVDNKQLKNIHQKYRFFYNDNSVNETINRIDKQISKYEPQPYQQPQSISSNSSNTFSSPNNYVPNPTIYSNYLQKQQQQNKKKPKSPQKAYFKFLQQKQNQDNIAKFPSQTWQRLLPQYNPKQKNNNSNFLNNNPDSVNNYNQINSNFRITFNQNQNQQKHQYEKLTNPYSNSLNLNKNVFPSQINNRNNQLQQYRLANDNRIQNQKIQIKLTPNRYEKLNANGGTPIQKLLSQQQKQKQKEGNQRVDSNKSNIIKVSDFTFDQPFSKTRDQNYKEKKIHLSYQHAPYILKNNDAPFYYTNGNSKTFKNQDSHSKSLGIKNQYEYKLESQQKKQPKSYGELKGKLNKYLYKQKTNQQKQFNAINNNLSQNYVHYQNTNNSQDQINHTNSRSPQKNHSKRKKIVLTIRDKQKYKISQNSISNKEDSQRKQEASRKQQKEETMKNIYHKERDDAKEHQHQHFYSLEKQKQLRKNTRIIRMNNNTNHRDNRDKSSSNKKIKLQLCKRQKYEQKKFKEIPLFSNPNKIDRKQSPLKHKTDYSPVQQQEVEFSQQKQRWQKQRQKQMQNYSYNNKNQYNHTYTNSKGLNLTNKDIMISPQSQRKAKNKGQYSNERTPKIVSKILKLGQCQRQFNDNFSQIQNEGINFTSN